MSTQAQTIPASSTVPAKSKSQAQQYVEGQLAQTGRQVVTNDLIMVLVGALSWVVGCLVFAIIVDAWVFPLTVALRWAVLIVLVGGLIFWLGWRLFPLFFRRVNPTYSAQMIERSKDQFHNSLLNYTLLNEEESAVNQHVLQVVTQKAAQDLSQVAGIERIDRSGLIRLGFAFVCLVALFVAYAILSPKSPWPSIMRVLAPNADVNRPSAVSITNVQPGDTDVFFGRRLLVSCQVRGKHDPDSVSVVLSTDDGRMSQIRQFMRLADEDTSTYQIELTTSPKGIDSSFIYRIEAGDGQTRDYRVKVNMNPTITVDAVIITSPPYTKIPERTYTSTANLSGVEGARVKVAAIANLPIGSANIELLNIPADAPTQSGTVVSTIKMVPTENQAEGEFYLTFNRRANVPDFTHFQLRFTSTSGDRNENANVYSIRIIPDLGPEIRFVKPTEKEIRVPVNQLANLEITANDLDYELESVRLFVEHRGATLLNEPLPFPNAENRRVFAGRYPLSPERLQLKPGDEVLFYAKAADNRHAPINGHPEPNEARTENYRLIVEQPSEQPQENNSDEADDPQDEKTPPENQQSEDQQDNTNDDAKSEEGESDAEADSKDEQGAEDGAEKGQEMSDGENESQETNEGGEADMSESGSGDNAKSDGTGGDADSQKKGETGEGATDENDGNSSDDPSQSQSEDLSDAGDGSQAESGSDSGERDRQLQEGEETPLDEDATDSERFEKIRQMMEREQQNRENADSDPDDPDSQSQDQQDRQPPSSDDARSGNQTKPTEDKQEDENSSEKDGNTGTENRPPEGKEPPDPQSSGGENNEEGEKPPPEGEESKDEKGSGEGDPDSKEKPKQDAEVDSQTEKSDPPPTDPNQKNDQNEGGDSSPPTSENDSGADGPEKQGDASQGTDQSSQPSQGDPSDSKKSDPAAEQSPPGESGGSGANDQAGGGSGGGSSSGGGSENTGDKKNAGDSPPPKLGENLPIEEREELKYKKDATDLALKYLKDQPDGPERDELLRQLNMTEDQLTEFMKRWQEMADKAKSGDAKAQQLYERALRSLGLKTPRSQIKGQTQRMENLSEGGAVSRPPAEVQDSFQDFLRNLNRLDSRRDE